mmetsp:Transcript_63497/g.136524  ORF Transcript_63497/g.136524 Transcript_63497/m.136524 type:complete len:90 (-) Transcript_63497:949-1218(-)
MPYLELSQHIAPTSARLTRGDTVGWHRGLWRQSPPVEAATAEEFMGGSLPGSPCCWGRGSSALARAGSGATAATAVGPGNAGAGNGMRP